MRNNINEWKIAFDSDFLNIFGSQIFNDIDVSIDWNIAQSSVNSKQSYTIWLMFGVPVHRDIYMKEICAIPPTITYRRSLDIEPVFLIQALPNIDTIIVKWVIFLHFSRQNFYAWKRRRLKRKGSRRFLASFSRGPHYYVAIPELLTNHFPATLQEFQDACRPRRDRR